MKTLYNTRFNPFSRMYEVFKFDDENFIEDIKEFETFISAQLHIVALLEAEKRWGERA